MSRRTISLVLLATLIATAVGFVSWNLEKKSDDKEAGVWDCLPAPGSTTCKAWTTPTGLCNIVCPPQKTLHRSCECR